MACNFFIQMKFVFKALNLYVPSSWLQFNCQINQQISANLIVLERLSSTTLNGALDADFDI